MRFRHVSVSISLSLPRRHPKAYIRSAATTMFIAWQYPISSFTQLYAVSTRLNRPIPSSFWKPGYSGRLRLRSFSISSIARDSRPENLSRVSVYSLGFCSRMYNEPDVSSHISPRSRFGSPTRISFWKSNCRIRVAFRPFSIWLSAYTISIRSVDRPRR